MPFYLIYQDSSIDEGSRTMFVGPFATADDRDVVRRLHAANSGGGWARGHNDWSCVGAIDGEITGVDLDSPHELLWYYPNTTEHVAKVRACAKTLARMGFPIPEWVGELDCRVERKGNGFTVAAAPALRVWAAESQHEAMQVALFGRLPAHQKKSGA